MVKSFQSTLPHEERLKAPGVIPPDTSFNPRSRTRSDTWFLRAWLMILMFQSTLPHEERQAEDAPPLDHLVSIHAPARGATCSESVSSVGSTCFNPRSRTRSDDRPCPDGGSRGVSIHAPARGATPSTGHFSFSTSFNPRSRTRSDRQHAAIHSEIWGFQSTLPHEERRPPGSWFAHRVVVSIHAPARGATRAVPALYRRKIRFNPRSRTRSDLISPDTPSGDSVFQSTLPHEERLTLLKDAYTWIVVSIHAPARGAT